MASPKPSEGNPALRMMGLPRIRAKLPSRNWSIFLAIVGSWTSAVVYDRYQSSQTTKRYSSLVSHLSREPLPTSALPRKVTVYLCAPPGDSMQPAREHWEKFVKPIFVAAALDFDIVEGRQPGEMRVKVAEAVRKRRRGEKELLERIRETSGIKGPDDGGVVVVGRGAWREWITGTQEGWLGPLDSPTPQAPKIEMVGNEAVVVDSGKAVEGGAEPGTPVVEGEKKDTVVEKPKHPIPPAYLKPAEFSSASLPPDAPQQVGPVGAVHLPHILGFLNTPKRMYRFINRRCVAEDAGRQAAAVCLGVETPFEISAPSPEGILSPGEIEKELSAEGNLSPTEAWRAENTLKFEEDEWVKKVWDDTEERYAEWREPVVVDDRLRQRLRGFCLALHEDIRLKMIAEKQNVWDALWPWAKEKTEEVEEKKEDVL